VHVCMRGMRQVQFISIQDESTAFCKGGLESVEQSLYEMRCLSEPRRVSDKSHENLKPIKRVVLTGVQSIFI
jgi:hypothetical protein